MLAIYPEGYYNKEKGYTQHKRRIKGVMNMFTKDSIIGDILDTDPTTAPYFLDMGMHCLGCPSARSETLAQACEVHGVDCDELVKKLNDHTAK